jgi:hypothetical protein
LRFVGRSNLATFFAGFFPSIGRSISFWPAAVQRGLITLHASGAYLTFTQAGSDLFA